MHTIEKNEIASAVTSIFGEEHIKAAFITGGIAAGSASATCDVDIFVCHDGKASNKSRNEFTDYYMNLHRELGRVPDVVSPGEVMTDEELRLGLERVYTMDPTKVIESRNDFDYICWAGMLVSKKELLVRPSEQLVTYEDFSRKVMKKWVKGIFGNIAPTYATGEMSDYDKILARTLSCPGYYDAHK